jgi:hypothetical protein
MSGPLFQAVLLLGTVTFLNSGGAYAQAGKTPNSPERLEFRVRVYNDEGVPERSLAAARKTADAVLEKADLQAIWQDCTVGNPSRDSSGCDRHPAGIDLVLYLVTPLETHAPNVDRSALGYSIIPENGGHATMAYVCFSRVRALRSVFSVEELLGLAMAHEIGHLLLGTHLHSNSGLMRATWPRKDLEERGWEKFAFTSEQVTQLRAAVTGRLES